ncbi:right-handed parallel beta-helix repeat-containing protein [Mucilaginibacter sp. PAMB04274]|uniref:right-handed parallel beta-helix repeat-containing protein n=1 Tax=Mucilaginibacter sp. PAMB04274 TaxID=3138568 RepID=UPI0031F5F552
MKIFDNLYKAIGKTIALCLLTALSNSGYATVYYFSSSTGNDDYNSLQARNPATPWKSLSKLNTFFRNLNSGDSVLFKRGDVFNGSIIASKSGAVFSPIYLGAYGSGKTPEINGLATLTNWKQVKTGVFQTACEATGSLLLVNGAQKPMGRYPNAGYLSYESHQANSSITDKELADDINWTGAEVVIRKNRWIIDKSQVTSQAGGTLTYAAGTRDMPTNGYGYFIQKSAKTLDVFGEWYYDAAGKNMQVYFGSKNPNALAVKTSVVNNLVDIRRFNYITFENLAFTGAGNNTFNIIQAKNITIKNCSIDMTGAEAVYANYTPFMSVENCQINHSLSSGISFDAGCANSSILNNHIQNTGLIAGAGKSGSGTYEAITSFGDNTKIVKNTIDSVGYNGIYFGGNSSYVKNNYIAYFCLVKDDGGGIYIGDWTKTINKKVIGNIILHGVGNASGAGRSTSLQAEGIYIDDNSQSVTIASNTVAMCNNNGIKIHNAKDVTIHNNNVVNNGVQLRLEQDHYLVTSSYIRNNKIRNNTFMSASPVQSTAKFSTHQDDISEFGQLDSNYYYQPARKTATIEAATVKNGKNDFKNYNLANWKSTSGKDISSTEANSESMLFEYNASNSSKTVVLKNRYVDAHNNVYSGKINIGSYSSVVLLLSSRQPAKVSRVAAVDVPRNNAVSYLAANTSRSASSGRLQR